MEKYFIPIIKVPYVLVVKCTTHSGIQRKVYLAPELAQFRPMESEPQSKSRIYERVQPIQQLLRSAARWTGLALRRNAKRRQPGKPGEHGRSYL